MSYPCPDCHGSGCTECGHSGVRLEWPDYGDPIGPSGAAEFSPPESEFSPPEMEATS